MTICPFCGEKVARNISKCSRCMKPLTTTPSNEMLCFQFISSKTCILILSLGVLLTVGILIISSTISKRRQEARKIEQLLAEQQRIIEKIHMDAQVRSEQTQRVKANWSNLVVTGTALLKQKKYEEALKQFNQMLAVNPKSENIRELAQEATRGITNRKQAEARHVAEMIAQAKQRKVEEAATLKQLAAETKTKKASVQMLASSFAQGQHCPETIMIEIVKNWSIVPAQAPCFDAGSSSSIKWLNKDKTKAQASITLHCKCMTGSFRYEPTYEIKDYIGGRIICEEQSRGQWSITQTFRR